MLLGDLKTQLMVAYPELMQLEYCSNDSLLMVLGVVPGGSLSRTASLFMILPWTCSCLCWFQGGKQEIFFMFNIPAFIEDTLKRAVSIFQSSKIASLIMQPPPCYCKVVTHLSLCQAQVHHG
jgi:hypothetical protein